MGTNRLLIRTVVLNWRVIEDIDQQISLNESRLPLENKAIAFFTVLGAWDAPQFLGQTDSPPVNLRDSVGFSLVAVEVLGYGKAHTQLEYSFV